MATDAATPLPSLDAFLGCLLGGALGDALGYPIEFDRGEDIVRRQGTAPPEGLICPGRDGLALVSDDTQMTLFTAEGLIRAQQRWLERGICDPVGVVAGALLRWYATQGGDIEPDLRSGWLLDEPRLGARRAPGNTCLSALSALAAAPVRRGSVVSPPNDSKGCGAVMRAAPCGLAAATREIAFELGRDTGALTHGHPSGYLASAYVAAVIWDLARGSSMGAALDAADRLLSSAHGREELERTLSSARELARRGRFDRAAVESLGGGWTGEEALAIAILCASGFDAGRLASVRDALWCAAAHSGDSDSTAAIAGNLLGARVGAKGLPEGWLAGVELRGVIERIGRDLHRSCVLGEELDRLAYPPN